LFIIFCRKKEPLRHFLFVFWFRFLFLIFIYSSEISPGSNSCFFTGLGGEQSGVLGVKCAGFCFLGLSSSESNVMLTTFFSTAAPAGRR
jgi:hypothetical protein